jgi:HD-GYP domain-containing protein (c-di-GMP phosphodiesterase class II)
MGIWIYIILVATAILAGTTLFLLLRLIKVYSSGLKILRETVVELDAKDPYFNGHIKSVENLSLLVASEMKFSKRKKDELKLAIYLTEIGKIRIPDYILTKREKLTDDEMSIVKKHPIVACRMVENIKGLEKISKIIRAHHERYDGEGYPDNMLGDTIPIESRIINIVDSYTAMTSERPYKKSLSENQAIEELRKGKGKQFDGDIVEKLITILKK